jgi:peroxiredoxin
MNKMKPLTTSAIILLCLSLLLFGLDIKIPAYFFPLIAIVIITPELFKYTGNIQLFTIGFNALALAAFLFFDGFYISSAGIIVAGISLLFRFLSFEKVGYSTYTWVDISLAIASVICVVYGNIIMSAGWEKWLGPGLLTVFCSFVALGNFMGSKFLIKTAKQGYAAEIGNKAPEFSLQDHTGDIVNTNDFINKKNLLLIFVKGDWCPGCHMMLRCYEKNREKFSKKDIVVMAIGPDPVGVNKEMVSKLGLEYKVLSDEKQEVVKKYGIKINSFPGAPKEQETTPLPASFLIDKSGVVRYSSRPDKAGEFLNPSLIFPVLDSINNAA